MVYFRWQSTQVTTKTEELAGAALTWRQTTLILTSPTTQPRPLRTHSSTGQAIVVKFWREKKLAKKVRIDGNVLFQTSREQENWAPEVQDRLPSRSQLQGSYWNTKLNWTEHSYDHRRARRPRWPPGARAPPPLARIIQTWLRFYVEYAGTAQCATSTTAATAASLAKLSSGELEKGQYFWAY